MGWTDVALGALVLVAGALLNLRWWRRRRSRAVPADASAVEVAQPKRADTALSELRALREALAPATHNRVERRRSPPPGSVPSVERRKKGARRIL